MKIGRRIRKNTWGLVASLAAVAALGLTTMFTLGGFSAAINNNTSTFSSATIQLEENNGTIQCYSTGSGGTGGTVTATNTNSACAINALVGTLDQVPGGTALEAQLVFTNVGNHAISTATLAAGTCAVTTASDAAGYVGGDTSGFCGKVDVAINNVTTSKCVYPYSATTACTAPGSSGTLTGLATYAASPISTGFSALAAGASATYDVYVQLDGTSATNADQGLTATLPLTWTISQ
jgi:hypothetical protein